MLAALSVHGIVFLQAKQQEKQNTLRQSEPHPSMVAAQEQAMHSNQGHIPTPLELIEANDAQQQAIAAQQLAQQQQAAAAQVSPILVIWHAQSPLLPWDD